MGVNFRANYRYNDDGSKTLKGYYFEAYNKRRRPKRKRVSLGTKNKSAARQRFVELEKQYMAGLFDPWSDDFTDEGMTLAQARQRFITSREEHCAESTVETYEVVTGLFVEDLPPGFPLYGVERQHVLDFLAAGDWADATHNSYQDRLRIFLGWCSEQGFIDANPVPEKKRSKKSRAKKLPEFLTTEQFGRLVRAIEADEEMKGQLDNGWLLDAIRFTVNTGLRRGELCHLRWNAVDLYTGMVRVENAEGFSTKSGRERSVPLVGAARAIAKRLHGEWDGVDGTDFVFGGANGGQLNGDYLTKRFRFYRRLAKLPENVSFHSLRHTFASWFVQRGGDLYRLKEILGHADMKTTLRYAHLRPDALRQEMQKCFGVKGGDDTTQRVGFAET